MSELLVPTVAVGGVPPEALLLDVREDDEWTAGHAPEARHLPMGLVRAGIEELPADREIVVVCRSGHRSAHVTAYLVGLGHRASNLDGGMLAWAAADRAMTTETGAPPRVL